MKNIWVWVVVIIIVVGGVWWWSSSSAPVPSATNGTPAPIDAGAPPVAPEATTTAAPADTGAPLSVSVAYDGKSFSPSTVTIKKGGSVTWSGTTAMWVGSAPHPAHTGYDGTSRSEHCAAGYAGAKPFDQCVGGSSYTFTFDKVGTWPYHDHRNSGAFGTVIVVE